MYTSSGQVVEEDYHNCINSKLVGGRWRLSYELDTGTVHEVYVAKDVDTGEVVAVKFEKADIKCPGLCNENEIYEWFHGAGTSSIVGIPWHRYYGVNEQSNVLVMHHLGPSLKDLLSYCRGRCPSDLSS